MKVRSLFYALSVEIFILFYVVLVVPHKSKDYSLLIK